MFTVYHGYFPSAMSLSEVEYYFYVLYQNGNKNSDVEFKRHFRKVK